MHLHGNQAIATIADFVITDCCCMHVLATEASDPLVGILHTTVDELIRNTFTHFLEFPSCSATIATTANALC